MVEEVFLDVDVILDYVLGTGDYASVEYIIDKISSYQLYGYFPAGLVPLLSYLLEQRVTKTPHLGTSCSEDKLKRVMSLLRLVTTTGKDVLEDLNAENNLIVEVAQRVCPNAIIITNCVDFLNQLKAFTPEGFVKYYNDQNEKKSAQVPFLDLKREYASLMEEMDQVLLSVGAKAQYIMGQGVSQFEADVAAYLGTKYAIGVASGTDALVLSLRALAIQKSGQEFFSKDDLIITSPFTFTATGDTILRAGATPLFVDINPDDFNLNIEHAKRVLSTAHLNNYRIVGILPVHLFGHSCDMDAIMEVAEQYGLFVLEDVAQAFGAEWMGKKLGSCGTIGAFSFYPTKNLGGFGDGGLVTTNDNRLAELVKMLLRHGGKDKYNVEHIGYNSRLDILQASILQVKLRYIDKFNLKRRTTAAIYNRGLQDLTHIKLPLYFDSYQHIYHQYTIRVTGGYRDQLRIALKEKGISTMVYYPILLHRMKVFDGRCVKGGNLENVAPVCDEVLNLPVGPLMLREEVELVVTSIREFFNNGN